MIIKIKGLCSGNWFLFDTDEVEWRYHAERMNPIEERQAERIFFNEKDERNFYYRLHLKKTKGDYRQFVCNTEIYILNNDGKTVETLR